jgi:hypothetical protein
MHKKIITAGLTLASFSMVGGMAYAATQSVSTRPSPQVVIPAASRSDDRSTATTVDDRLPGVPAATDHDAGDDRTTPTTPPSPGTVTTVAGVDDRARSGLDDGVGHEAGDDRTLTTAVPTTAAPRTSVPATTVPDDRGRHVEPGDDRGTSGSSGPSTPTTSPSSSNSGRGSNSSGSGSSGSGSGGSGSSGSGSGSGSGGSGRSGKDG